MTRSRCPRTGEQIVKANGVDIAHEAFGTESDEPVVLITGLGMQMLWWPDDFCEGLAARGYYVIRFDNRDTGRSSKIEGGPKPNLLAAFAGVTDTASYTLTDMAADTAGLIEALGFRDAHVIGVSLGGTIAQTLAIEHPERVRTLTSIMSTTGALFVRLPDPRVLFAFARRPRYGKAHYVRHVAHLFDLSRSPGFETDPAETLAMLEASVSRAYHPAASPRQMLAMLASGDRTRALRRLSVPTLVVHGTADVMMPVQGGRATARAGPGARYIEIEGMGHDLPRALWPSLFDAIDDLAERAASGARAQHRSRGLPDLAPLRTCALTLPARLTFRSASASVALLRTTARLMRQS